MSKTSRSIERQRTDINLEFEVSTFGSQDFHKLYSLNISCSGALLSGFYTVPFSTKSLLEITIDPKMVRLSEPIRSIAKIARIAKGDAKGLDKYKTLLGESNNLMSVIGIYYTEFHSESEEQKWVGYVKRATQSTSKKLFTE